MTNKNPSEWRVSCNPVCGDRMYGVYRIRDVNEVDHSGNRETIKYFHSKDDAEHFANLLNQEGES